MPHLDLVSKILSKQISTTDAIRQAEELYQFIGWDSTANEEMKPVIFAALTLAKDCHERNLIEDISHCDFVPRMRATIISGAINDIKLSWSSYINYNSAHFNRKVQLNWFDYACINPKYHHLFMGYFDRLK
jgi:hypothetical protein